MGRGVAFVEGVGEGFEIVVVRGLHIPTDPAVAATFELDSHDDCTHGTGGGFERGPAAPNRNVGGVALRHRRRLLAGRSMGTSGSAARLDRPRLTQLNRE
jgi:hypothetical protein